MMYLYHFISFFALLHTRLAIASFDIFHILSFDLVKRLNMYNFISNILIGNQIFNSIHCCTFWLETKLYKNVKNEFAM